MVDCSIPGAYVVRSLERAVRFRGVPKAIRTDQGPEFTGKALDQWAYERGVQLIRDECLNEHWFTSLAHARAEIAA